MKQVCMNSQTLRIVNDDNSVVDYHITDGNTATYFIKIVNGEFDKDDLTDYPTEKTGKNSNLTWCTEVDSKTPKYTNAGSKELECANDSDYDYGNGYSCLRVFAATPTYSPTYHISPGNTSSAIHDKNKAAFDKVFGHDKNEENFKKIFGGK